jgi:broad specificity phosphatase PhoE
MTHLVLVKHSLPAIVPEQSSREWILSERGRYRCWTLAARLAAYRPEAIVTSVEPRAKETAAFVAERLGVPCEEVENLHENDRTGFPFLETAFWKAALAAFFANPHAQVIGNETAEQAYRRFEEAIEHAVQRHSGRNLAVVTHGTVLSLFVARKNGLKPFPLWEQLDCPSFIVLSLPDYRLRTVADNIESGR